MLKPDLNKALGVLGHGAELDRARWQEHPDVVAARAALEAAEAAFQAADAAYWDARAAWLAATPAVGMMIPVGGTAWLALQHAEQVRGAACAHRNALQGRLNGLRSALGPPPEPMPKGYAWQAPNWRPS